MILFIDIDIVELILFIQYENSFHKTDFVPVGTFKIVNNKICFSSGCKTECICALVS